ncbi:protein kinase-like protein [Xylariomycetidae sp. FL2044]|nr:protein kinase-like protein [Xylariomycetidae sp. FL2044]
MIEGAPFGLEKICDYEPGSHHPVHLGDVINTRYLIMHKLGNGRYANVWLCRDLQDRGFKYLAVKILIAEGSTPDCPELNLSELTTACDAGENASAAPISLPLDRFEIHGPNGTHLCFVYPVAGPSVKLGLFDADDPDKVLRSICFKAVQALSFLHKHGICHGDFTPANILHKLLGIDGRSEQEVMQILGEPERTRVLQSPDEPHTLTTAPQQHIDTEPCVIDFGESFKMSAPPEDLGIPPSYRGPEAILDGKIGVFSDLWALGCTLFEIRTGRKLFQPFEQDDDEFLLLLVELLGPLPEPWWSTTWARRRSMWLDMADEQGRAVSTIDGDSWKSELTGTVHPSVAEGARSLQEKLAPGVWYMSDGSLSGDKGHRAIKAAEIETFADLLGQLLRYQPEERISAEDALRHRYFEDVR